MEKTILEFVIRTAPGSPFARAVMATLEEMEEKVPLIRCRQWHRTRCARLSI